MANPDRAESRKCATCGSPFRLQDAGGLSCFVHPGELDQDTLHYTCCGATFANGTCRRHAQASRAIPEGCHRIDHFETTDERDRVLKQRPYTLAPLEQARSGMPYAARHNGRTVIYITDEHQLSQRDFFLNLPCGWKGEGDVVNGRIYPDLRAEHDTLRQAIVDRDRDLQSQDDSAYETEWSRYMDEVEDTATPAFVPFAIIMRVSPDADAERSVDRHAPCVY